jgi:hypothetical protein
MGSLASGLPPVLSLPCHSRRGVHAQASYFVLPSQVTNTIIVHLNVLHGINIVVPQFLQNTMHKRCMEYYKFIFCVCSLLLRSQRLHLHY